ncbi:nucleotide pyrophosphohydrolase [Candidatus Berkelbacteria bacterium]|nr:nucleotide pyrophosphohydrolase [Candidatus Berkelbacteria bacterium]
MEEIERSIQLFAKEREWDNLRPADLAKSIMIEGAELLENFQWDSPTAEDILADEKKLAAVKKELADVMIYALQLSILLKLDTREIILAKLAQNAKKYPVDVVRARREAIDKKGTSEDYWKLKQRYRQSQEVKS